MSRWKPTFVKGRNNPAVYYNATDYGPMRGGGEESGGAGGDAVVVTGGNRIGRGKEDGSGRGGGIQG